LEENVPTLRLLPTTLKAWQLPSFEATQMAGSGWATLHELLVAGRTDYLTRRSESVWSNVLVLPGFAIDDRLRLDTEGKASAALAISLRGRQLEGAIFVGADLRKADFTGAHLAHADFTLANLREATFACGSVFGMDDNDQKCAQLQGAVLQYAGLQGASISSARLQGAKLDSANLQGASFMDAQAQGASFDLAHLQGTSLFNAQLQGASLRAAELQGADLTAAKLQGATLFGTKLQGAVLVDANLQGAVLDDTQLQGVNLDGARLQTAFLRDVLVWRTKPPAREDLKGALIERLHSKPIDIGRYCAGKSCDWDDASYEKLKASLETVPEGSRTLALERIKALGQVPSEEDVASANVWSNLAAESLLSAGTYPEDLVRLLTTIGCDVGGAPYVISGLIRRLTTDYIQDPFSNSFVPKAEVARVFLDETNCSGARGLSEENKAKLRQIGTTKTLRPSPKSGSQ
jgi:uncharacterized protein YjbI with pentapeptide repeats